MLSERDGNVEVLPHLVDAEAPPIIFDLQYHRGPLVAKPFKQLRPVDLMDQHVAGLAAGQDPALVNTHPVPFVISPLEGLFVFLVGCDPRSDGRHLVCQVEDVAQGHTSRVPGARREPPVSHARLDEGGVEQLRQLQQLLNGGFPLRHIFRVSDDVDPI